MDNFRASPDLRSEADIRGAVAAEILASFADAELAWDQTHGAMNIRHDDLAMAAGSDTAVLISLFTDAPAGEDDELPNGDRDRRGWWADALNEQLGDVTGSKLWLLSREKQEARVLRRAEEYARAALAWLVEDRVAARVSVAASIPRVGWLLLGVEIVRPDRRAVTFKYDYNWRAQEQRAAL